MDFDSNSKQDCCRLCLTTKKVKYIDIYEPTSSNLNVPEILNKYFENEVNE